MWTWSPVPMSAVASPMLTPYLMIASPGGTVTQGDLMAQRDVGCGTDRHRGIVLHAPAFSLFTARENADSDTDAIAFVVDDEPNHSSFFVLSAAPGSTRHSVLIQRRYSSWRL